MPATAQRQFLVKVSGIDGYFAQKTGGATTADTTDVWDGGARRPEKLASPATTEDIVVTRPYKPERDRAMINTLRKVVGAWRTTVSVSDLDPELNVVPKSKTVYGNALLRGINEPDVDASSGEPAMVELTFAVETIAG